PAAFALLAVADGDPWLACRLGASVGGDCDTIAAIAGAVSGAIAGASAFPADVMPTLEAVNGLGIGELATDLLALR
ncbi:MAG: ADP-ribosylglycohydrolase family protein, partial [Cellulomonadaceae bacterium]|nr:ADP-ribosylglycohydrolase family protein [Cellulomonadaceae bacterium]